MSKSLFQKVWETHTVRTLANGQTQLLIGTHLIHEVTSPQAFGMLRDLGLTVLMPHRTFATVDHIVPTDQVSEPYADPLADAMIKALRRSCREHGITFFDRATGKQGIVHIVGPEQGITQPGTTLGPLRASVAAECGLTSTKVVLPGSHATASAVPAPRPQTEVIAQQGAIERASQLDQNSRQVALTAELVP